MFRRLALPREIDVARATAARTYATQAVTAVKPEEDEETMIQKRTNHTHGPGAAHIGFAMFGARGPLMNEVDAGGGAGGSAAGASGNAGGEGNAGASGQAQQQSGGASPKLFTQADLDRIVAERVARVKQSGGGGQVQRTEQRSEADSSTGNGQKKQTDSAPGMDAAWLIEFGDAIDAVSEEMGAKVSAGMKKRMRAIANAEGVKADGMQKYVKDFGQEFGLWKKTDNTQNTNQNGEQRQQTTQQHTTQTINSDKGGATNADVRDLDDVMLNERPLEITGDAIARLQEKHGFDKANEMIKSKVDVALSKLKLVADPVKLAQLRRAKQ